nr:immunoglobulin light chain junction region [Macaca mulatta]MOY09901.1 immunoglobulin light chain junction region [Macaca mulatta]MOY10064.1 immunoglobulin light chain junction region [Macaca mulatta]
DYYCWLHYSGVWIF